MEPKTPGEQIVRAKLLHKILTEFGAYMADVRMCVYPPALSDHTCSSHALTPPTPPTQKNTQKHTH
jgi:hypothetical protein